MNRSLKILTVLSFALCTAPFISTQQGPSNAGEARIQKEVRHELATLPFFTVFDYIAFQVNGNSVTLIGQVTKPTLKSEAENSIKHIEGVDHVVNNIQVLPPSPLDNQLRLALYRSIYGFPSLEKYAMGVQRPIRIIVNNGHVTLEGVVDTQTDKDTAGLRANGIPNIFSVTNNLQVAPH